MKFSQLDPKEIECMTASDEGSLMIYIKKNHSMKFKEEFVSNLKDKIKCTSTKRNVETKLKTKITTTFYSIFLALGIVSSGILGVIVIKRFQHIKAPGQGRKHLIERMQSKFESSFRNILQRVVKYGKLSDKNECSKANLEISIIERIAKHQLGHFEYTRFLLK